MGATSMARGGRVTRFLPGFRRELGCDQKHHGTSFGDIEFEFLDDISDMSSLANSSSSGEYHTNEIMELDEDDGGSVDFSDVSIGDNRSFWDNKNQLLQANLCRTSSVESRIRNASKEAIEEIKSTETVCNCSRQMAATTSCTNCFMTEVCRRLQNAGFDCAICKTKWRTSLNIPSGEHTFLDIIDTTSSKKGNVIRVIIELNFRAEFEMAKASEDYNRLVRRLPEVFVGKVEILSNLIKILCMAAKRCMKENKMHMGPWRKYRYMQAKWLGPCERTISTTTSLSMGFSERIPKPKPKASMLTVDLLDKLPNMHCKGRC
ncbi:hypothetical protein Lal_00025989 [Lupinus albus]|uniref:Uncharacterized protein n=1 Tax=Lupinus albus TaxID=3870 RepID=A0A6A5LJW1_LUPAL|nr:hypothetical protein Lalb_Chr09g0327661 [Lupinus albus]KAF1861606.1 hypothetical protein Lal_00025989 [Lupinus albus]